MVTYGASHAISILFGLLVVEVVRKRQSFLLLKLCVANIDASQQTLRWRHMNVIVVSNHRSFDCLHNSLCEPTSTKHQSPRYWPFVGGIHRLPVNSTHKRPVTRKKLPFDDVIMEGLWYVKGFPWNFIMTEFMSLVLGPLLLMWVDFNPSMDK